MAGKNNDESWRAQLSLFSLKHMCFSEGRSRRLNSSFPKMSKSYPPGPVNEIHGKKGLAHEIQLRILRWGGYPGLISNNLGEFLQEDRRVKVRVRRCENRSRSQRGEKILHWCLGRQRKGPGAEQSKQPLKPGRGKSSPIEASEGLKTCRCPDLSPGKRILDFWPLEQ